MKRITEKQDKFCQFIIEGKTAKEAYLSAYSTKMSDNSASTEAYKLLQKPEIQERLEILKKPIIAEIQSQQGSKLQEQISFIKSRIEICKINEDEQSIIRYTDMLNKIYGIYKEQPDTNDKPDKMTDIDTNTLKLLVGAG